MGRSSDKPYEITASIGWASAPYSENVVSELLNTADERMYENKLMRKKKGYDIQSYHCLGVKNLISFAYL